jgi:group II intron reverse transcriptase/maturase
MLLLEAQKYLEIVRKRGEAGAKLRRVYYNIVTNTELYYLAYVKLYANEGAMTPGVETSDIVDGMSQERITAIITKLKNREYVWKPTRRTYILKRDGKSKRPLGMPGWDDKMVQEVVRLVLEAYYEPQFRDSSHGFRPARGCHTALTAIGQWTGMQWFIEGDIQGCFDNLDHQVIVDLLKRHIKDASFLRLIEGMLQAGYFEDWHYHRTYSGTPQGGIVSPLLANVVLHELDRYVEDTLIPCYTKGNVRRRNHTYMRLADKAGKMRRKGNYTEAKRLHKMYSKLPTQVYEDPEFRRLKYVRYADDFLVGFIGTKAEAEDIKQNIGNLLHQDIKLAMSEEKTVITHAASTTARFLNYEIGITRSQKAVKTRMKNTRTTRRSLNGHVALKVPKDVGHVWRGKVTRQGKPAVRPELLEDSDFDIIHLYNSQVQGLINYYSLAENVAREMWRIRDWYRDSLIKTLAAKHKTSTHAIIKKSLRYTADGRKVIAAEVQREGKKPLRAVYGVNPIRRSKTVKIIDSFPGGYNERNQLIDRLLSDTCELCGKTGSVEGHHIKKLKDLRKKNRKLQAWEKRMIAIRRKTLFVCGECHAQIHNGQYDGKKLT